MKPKPWERTEYAKYREGRLQAFCYQCKKWHPAIIGERLDCPLYGPKLGRVVAIKE